MICAVLRILQQFDQLDLYNVAGVEYLVRRLKQLEAEITVFRDTQGSLDSAGGRDQGPPRFIGAAGTPFRLSQSPSAVTGAGASALKGKLEDVVAFLER